MADCIFRRSGIRAGRTALLGAVTLSVFLAGVPGAVSAASTDGTSAAVTAVRFWSLGETTRVAIEVDSDFKFKSSRLTNPERLFFDIQGARPEMVAKGIHTIPVGDEFVKQIRVAETQKGITRVVLDLESDKVEFTASQLSRPARLLVELRGKATARPSESRKPEVPVSQTRKAEVVEVAAVAPPPAPAITPAALVPAKLAKIQKAPPRRFDPPEMSSLPSPVRKFDEEVRTTMPPPALLMMAKPTKLATSLPPLASPPRAVVRAKADPPTTPLQTTPLREVMPARKTATGGQSLTRVLGLKLGRVVLDAGHGGHDNGTHGPSGLMEKDLVLDVSKRLGSLLEERLGSEVVYTRTTDTFIPLEERTRIANDRRADLFLSIHANSSPVRSVSGVETYYLSFTTSKTALETASRENASSERSIFELKDLLQKIALKDKVDESREFASRLQQSLYTISARDSKATKNRGIKRAPFVVLIGAEMPSVLAEIGFLTNASDEARLRQDEQRDKIAEALYRGIAAYAETLSRTVVALSK